MFLRLDTSMRYEPGSDALLESMRFASVPQFTLWQACMCMCLIMTLYGFNITGFKHETLYEFNITWFKNLTSFTAWFALLVSDTGTRLHR